MKATDVGLEDFVDWICVVASELIEEEEMSSLASRFSIRMSKCVAGSEGEATPSSDGKQMKRLF